jgi:dephospho-CoA kinase
MLVLGLTGSIAMGKSHAARVFRAFGVSVFDADAAVHALLGPGGAAVAPVAAAFPGSFGGTGGIDRQVVGRRVFGDADALRRLERILHPLVRVAERRFLQQACRRGERLVVLDIPLLFETGAERRCDRVAVVSAPAMVQAQRALRRPGMSAAKLAQIRAGQLPDRIKRRRADFVIRSGLDRGETLRQIQSILAALQDAPGEAWPHRWLRSRRGAG